MKPECSAIKEKMLSILSVISLFTAKKKNQGEYPLSVPGVVFVCEVC